VSDFQLLEAGLEPRRGPGAIVSLLRRGLRKLLRPVLVQLIQVLNSLSDRLEGVEGRLQPMSNRAELALDKIRHGETRADAAETRLDALEAAVEVLMNRTSGTTDHLQGLTNEHLDLCARHKGHQREHVTLEDRLEAFNALHWDHVALARRLATIEDVLAGIPRNASAANDGEPLLAFPGFDDHPRARVG
jgi:chromosome segregation ATPase